LRSDVGRCEARLGRCAEGKGIVEAVEMLRMVR
jgi:hypothetical protein